MLFHQDYGRRADQLNLKEKELRAKEAELRKLEQDLRATGGLKPEKNWPPCCAFTHHDIAGEVRPFPAMQPGHERSRYKMEALPMSCHTLPSLMAWKISANSGQLRLSDQAHCCCHSGPLLIAFWAFPKQDAGVRSCV